jgi:hypothetical protein
MLTCGRCLVGAQVDFEYVKLSAEAAKAAGTVSHFSLVTAQGANPNLWVFWGSVDALM